MGDVMPYCIVIRFFGYLVGASRCRPMMPLVHELPGMLAETKTLEQATSGLPVKLSDHAGRSPRQANACSVVRYRKLAWTAR